jgi:hypothetical protein
VAKKREPRHSVDWFSGCDWVRELWAADCEWFEDGASDCEGLVLKAWIQRQRHGAFGRIVRVERAKIDICGVMHNLLPLAAPHGCPVISIDNVYPSPYLKESWNLQTQERQSVQV